MLGNKNGKIYFGNSLGNRITTYKNLHAIWKAIHMNYKHLQKSDLCGLICIYFANSLYCNLKNMHVNDFILMKFFAGYL